MATTIGSLPAGRSEGIQLDEDRVSGFVGRSLMVVTALSPYVGYDKASAISHKANYDGTSLRDAALALGRLRPDRRPQHDGRQSQARPRTGQRTHARAGT
jgi:fumarate hydratase class II